ncbi:MAG: transcription-repair coupling factor [Xanthomonadales bacterium]|nr:transcription-repair coupling factor [Xanthomonadales bacterium]
MAKSRSLINPRIPQSAGEEVSWPELHGSARALAVGRAALKRNATTVIITRDSGAAQRLEREIGGLLPELEVQLFPDWETLPYDLFSPHPDIISDRIATLYDLHNSRRRLLIVPVATALQRLAPMKFVLGSGLQLSTGDRFDIQSERRRLEDAGYRCVPQVTDHGEFAVRGALFDLFPMGTEWPLRIELFDDEVESMRTFDPETQLSRDRIQQIDLLPAREYPFDEEAINAFRSAFRLRFDIDLRDCQIYKDVRNGIAFAGIEYYLPLFFEETDTLFDYLPRDSVLILDGQTEKAAAAYCEHVEHRYEERRHDLQRPVLRPDELYLDVSQWLDDLTAFARIHLGDETAESYGVEEAPRLTIHAPGKAAGAALQRFLETFEGRVVVAADSPGRREVLADELARLGHRPEPYPSFSAFLESDSRFGIIVAALSEGCQLAEPPVAILTDRMLHGERVRSIEPERRASRDPAALIRNLSDLHPGAPVVHEDYGVGRYLGLTRLDAGGLDGEFLTLEYAQGDKLYVPVASLDLISRYTGSSADTAPLHRLGGDQWEKAKQRAAKRARDVAAELLEIYARRQARKGRAMPVDPDAYEEFAAAFPFEETPDQEQAIEAVIHDLGQAQPMDRVICGDVGFGKTEVAMRAAFVAVHAGRQVAVLVPTTLLAQQHYQNFSDRFASWPVRVEVLSRFRTRKESQAVLDDLKAGKVDIVIGTHKLLQSDIRFKDLGLLVVDEEHRFGVRHKERLKKLRAEVDLLTLTATPIPRTLNMALSGMRDLSIIATPPARRMAVKTFTKQWDRILVREAIERELRRGGQVYFLHNEVETIGKIARELRELFPDIGIEIAHGQMREKELEQVMLSFYRREFNVLVCTTIIESGIDIPTANTIIINRADKLGLAQLHQLRGRVGRSHHRAFAYLVVPPPKAMTADARKRLEALESLDELGAGFTLATHDLEIRGAGELLGEEQSGQIQEIGFSLYTELLERAVAALKSGKIPEEEALTASHVQIDLHMPALIPDDFLPDVHTRLVLYKRIASCRKPSELDELRVEMIDRFGLLPDQVKNLFVQAELKLAAERLGILSIDVGTSGGSILFGPDPAVETAAIIQMVQSQPKIYRFDGADRIRFKVELPESEDRLKFAWQLIEKMEKKRAA